MNTAYLNCPLLTTRTLARNPLVTISVLGDCFDFGASDLMNVTDKPMQSGPDGRGLESAIGRGCYEESPSSGGGMLAGR